MQYLRKNHRYKISEKHLINNNISNCKKQAMAILQNPCKKNTNEILQMLSHYLIVDGTIIKKNNKYVPFINDSSSYIYYVDIVDISTNKETKHLYHESLDKIINLLNAGFNI